MIARFRKDGVELDLEVGEYVFVYLTLSYVLHGIALADHDFRNILGMTRKDAETLMENVVQAERLARAEGAHWNLGVPVAAGHERYQRFVARLAAEAAPDEAFVAAYMEDVTSELDRAIAEGATIALLNHPVLSEPVLDSIESSIPSGWSEAVAHLDERRIKLRIEANPSDPALWNRAVGSPRLHVWLLEQAATPAETLGSLARDGATKAVRNRAAQTYRRKSGV